ncbi:MAG: hypothetical protein EPN37_07265 [Chitinophagaceae bacterium]|nr:MAG: hypothetical protein EPN37_07265 [Chitinophagaceae bacterium]
MNIFETFINQINTVVMILILLGGIFATRYLTTWKITSAWKTLIVGTLFVTIYIGIKALEDTFKVADIESYFITYCVTTSLYELILKHFMDWIQNQLNSSKTGSDGSKQ